MSDSKHFGFPKTPTLFNDLQTKLIQNCDERWKTTSIATCFPNLKIFHEPKNYDIV